MGLYSSNRGPTMVKMTIDKSMKTQEFLTDAAVNIAR